MAARRRTVLMPQLVKGGKHAFGWSVVGNEGEIVLPPEAVKEYGFEEPERLILIPGSRTSGGFALGSVASVADSPIGAVLKAHPEWDRHEGTAGEVVERGGKPYCWAELRRGRVVIPLETLAKYGIESGDKLLVIRGSGRALGFAVRGPIVEEADRHPELDVFAVPEGQDRA
jgi:bifunctional DNA-binding transcriptional regulator/antitoxin component of YhaV-PrlF toxin-antitoxin module